MLFLWIKAFHIVSVVTWFAGLFYLPRLYVYHAMADDTVGIERFKVVERKPFYGIMILSDTERSPGRGPTGTWLRIKLLLVLVLIAYHVYCGKLLVDFEQDRNRQGHVYYRWLNEPPVLVLIASVVLVVVKPLS
jgi:putative membrane protein